MLSTALCALLPLFAAAQGWPENYSGVMLQGFYWDSYTDTNWSTLEDQADDMAPYIDLLWVPNSGYCGTMQNNMGYHPMYWFRHEGAFGTEATLRSMIQTFRQKGVGVIEDVVINHRVGVSNWVNFPAETYNGVTYQLGLSDICRDDECKDNGYNPTGAADTGEAWGYARDLDHTSANVQKNVTAYLNFLLNDLGYVGFRYDFVKGYAPKYTGQYNTVVQPQFSVGECWDSNKTVVTTWLNGTKVDDKIQSAAFDFPMKYYINSAFSNSGSNWAELDKAALSNDATYARYAVTFVDNHDTGRSASDGGAPLYANVEAANAFILTMPGTPCVWLSHWKSNKVAIKKLILTRKAAGITNQSAILSHSASSAGYVLSTRGTKGTLLLLLGSATADTSGYQLAVEGTNYKLYASAEVDLTALNDVKEDEFTAPSFCTVAEGETCAFFEAPTSWTTVSCWAWDSNGNYTGGSWPGVVCTKVGTRGNFNVWKWSWNGNYTGSTASMPTQIIFNNNNNGQQTADLDFTNGAYYNSAGAKQGVVTGIRPATGGNEPTLNRSTAYDLGGRPVSDTRRGLRIANGKKTIVR